MVLVWAFESEILCFAWMWDNVDAPETQVEDASAGAGKETHLTDVLVMLRNFRVADLWYLLISEQP